MSSEHLNKLKYLLETISAENDEIQGSTIVSTQGLPIVSLLEKGANDGIISAMSAAIQSVGQRAAEELKRGKLKRILLEGDNGTMIMTAAGPNAILVTLAKADASLGVIFMLMESLANKIEAILED